MSMEVRYVLDSNVFIEAAKRYYAFDLAPKFWEHLSQFLSSGQVQSIDHVKWELERGKDDLSEWVKNGSFGSGFASTDEDSVIEVYRKVMNWTQEQHQFYESAIKSFAAGADGWLIAYAVVKGFTVVTLESLQQDAKSRVPIPNVCKAFNVFCIDTFQMLRALGIKFE